MYRIYCGVRYSGDVDRLSFCVWMKHFGGAYPYPLVRSVVFGQRIFVAMRNGRKCNNVCCPTTRKKKDLMHHMRFSL